MIQRMFTGKGRFRRGQKSPHTVPFLTLIGLSLIGVGAIGHAPLLVWNASGSASIGLYRVVSGAAIRGDLVLARTPDSVRQLADERRYLPANVPLIKRIAGAKGDTVCAVTDAIFINDRRVAYRLMNDRFGRPLPRWDGCRLLAPEEIFLLMDDVSDSFDSRYFGPIPAAAIIGRLAPVWIE